MCKLILEANKTKKQCTVVKPERAMEKNQFLSDYVSDGLFLELSYGGIAMLKNGFEIRSS